MRHGYFHDGNREYIVEHADVPVLWMNYLGIRGLCAVISLSAVVDRPLPYGCITRVAAGQIVDVVEETEASPQVRQIGELNVGAYVVRGREDVPALGRIPLRP